jgi:hypothetical protein
MYRGAVSVRKICVLVLNLPRGAQTWIAMGGPGAISAETEAAWIIEHALYLIAYGQGGSKGQKPEMRPYPPGFEAANKKAQFTQSRAEKFRAKHHQRTE